MEQAVTKATFADYKRVKSRKVHQVIFEIPSELWPEAYRVLGEPSIETDQWFAIARMALTTPAPTPQEKGKNYAANAALLLQETPFRRFLAEPYQGIQVLDFDMADAELKQRLGIKSKSELNSDPAAAQHWRELRGEYETWMRT